jgi:uncharacterized protein (TIGR02246 family)
VVGGTTHDTGEEAGGELTRRLLVAGTLLFTVPLLAEPLKVFNREEASIRRMATRFAETWNQHDMEALAALFSEDADFVNVPGMYWKGRDQIRQEHARLHGLQFKESVLTVRSVTVRFLRPDVALAHIKWGLEGERDSDGTSRPPREGVMSWVVMNRDGDWRVASSHNTNARPASTTGGSE